MPGTLLFALAPDGWSLQHFLDGVLPKLVQARELLAHPSVKARRGHTLRQFFKDWGTGYRVRP